MALTYSRCHSSDRGGPLFVIPGAWTFEPVRAARLRPQDDGLPSLRDLVEVSFQGLDGAAVGLRSLLQLLERFLLSP